MISHCFKVKKYYEEKEVVVSNLISILATRNLVMITFPKLTGMWLSGRAFALHVKGPGFDPRHLQFLRDEYASLVQHNLKHWMLKRITKTFS